MSTTEELINKYFSDRSELEKMAQFEVEKRSAFSVLDKVASEAQMDISQLNEEDKVNLYNYLMTEMAKPEVTQSAESVQTQQNVQPQQSVLNQSVQPQVQTQPDQSNQFMNFVSADPQREQDFYYKMAEAQITSDFWAENAANKFLEKVAYGMSKIAEAMEGKEEVKEDKGSFEALAKERAMKMKEEHEKKAAFDELVTQRALQMINEGKV